MKTVKTSKELGTAIKNGEEYIYVEGDLKNKVIRIKMAGKIAWAFAAGSLAAAIACYLAIPATTTVSTVVAGPAGTIAGSAIPFTGSAIASTVVASALGVQATAVAIGIGVAFGGIGGVISLRDKYKIESKSDKGMILKRK